MNLMHVEREQTVGEEIFNSILHGVGTVVSLVGVVILIILSVQHRSLVYSLSYGVYGFSLVFLYLMSTLYHSIRHKKAKKVFQRLDHIGVFILIAGSYTPLLLLMSRDQDSFIWGFVGAIWTLAVIGSLMSLLWLRKVGVINLIYYVGMGLSAVLLIPTMYQLMGLKTLTIIALGGVCYLMGVPFYSIAKFKFSHALWHIFVLAGSVFHFIAVVSL